MFTSCERRQPESNPSHRSSGINAVPRNVTDEQQDVVAVDEDVVPVTTYVARPGHRVVSGSDIQQRMAHDPRRKECALQRGGGHLDPFVATCPLECLAAEF